MNLNDDNEEVDIPAKGKCEALRQLEEELKGMRAL
jgi:hypothetical protein